MAGKLEESWRNVGSDAVASRTMSNVMTLETVVNVLEAAATVAVSSTASMSSVCWHRFASISWRGTTASMTKSGGFPWQM